MMLLTADGCRARREALLESTDADLYVISNPRHVLYYSGYWSTPLQIGTWGTPHLLIDRAGKTTLLSHAFAPHLERAHVDQVETWQWYDAKTDAPPPLFPTMLAELAKRMPDADQTMAAEQGWLPHGLDSSEPVDLTEAILKQRRAKYPDELAMIREAVRVTEQGHVAAREAVRTGASELDVYNAIQAAMVSAAGEPILMLGDTAGGKRAWEGGGAPTDLVLQGGDVLIADLFPVIGGYKGDFTATYPASETVSDVQRKLDDALHAALAAGEAQLKPGVRAGHVYDAVKTSLDQHDFGQHFAHHAGHGIGLGHPEAPYFVPESDEIIVVGDVVTLEPGAYGDGFGARIEHNYLITDDGCERLTNHETRLFGG